MAEIKEASSALEKEPPQRSNRRFLLATFTLLCIGAGLGYVVYYDRVLSQREETDNAYVGGNLVTLTSQVSGIVTEIFADDTQLVSAGQDIIKLDPADATIALNRTEAELGETVRTVRQQFVNVRQYQAVIAQRRVDLARSQEDYARRLPLLKERAVSGEDVEHAKQAVSNAQEALIVAEKQLESAQSGIDGITITQHPSVLKARANLEQAYLALKRDVIQAPVAGYVAKRSVQVGQRISAGASLMSIVPLNALWVDANFKEPELRNIRIGQPAQIETDLYGSKIEYHGKVIGLAAGTGAVFSLLPAQNATGNWIKVVQRIPVRIQLDSAELKTHPLRVGLSATVTVDTHQRQGAVLATTVLHQPMYLTQVFTQSMKEANTLAKAIIAKNAGTETENNHSKVHRS